MHCRPGGRRIWEREYNDVLFILFSGYSTFEFHFLSVVVLVFFLFIFFFCFHI